MAQDKYRKPSGVETSLGLDGGTHNHGWGIVDIAKVVPLYHGMIACPINTLTEGFAEEQALYHNRIKSLHLRFGVKRTTAERFQTRGFGGAMIEKISLMNGVAMRVAVEAGSTPRLVIAGTWKNAYHRLHKDKWSLDSSYKEGLYPYAKERFNLAPHEVDASLIAVWGADISFEKINPPKWVALMARSVAQPPTWIRP